MVFDVEGHNTQGKRLLGSAHHAIIKVVKLKPQATTPIVYANDTVIKLDVRLALKEYDIWVARYNVKAFISEPCYVAGHQHNR